MPNLTTNFILINYIKNCLGYIYINILSLKLLYNKKIYLISFIIINIINNYHDNSKEI